MQHNASKKHLPHVLRGFIQMLLAGLSGSEFWISCPCFESVIPEMLFVFWSLGTYFSACSEAVFSDLTKQKVKFSCWESLFLLQVFSCLLVSCVKTES